MIRRYTMYFVFVCTCVIMGYPAFAEVSLQDVQDSVGDIEERLDVIETKSILNKITIGGEFRTKMETLSYQNYPVTNPQTLVTTKYDKSIDELWSNRLRLNLKGEITEDLVFHGRLTYYKLWSSTNNDSTLSDMSAAHFLGSEGKLHVEKAYVDYFVPGTPLSISFGRLPTSEGPPNELRDNSTRKATYPRVFIDAESDGVATTLALSQWTGLANSIFRFRYGKIFQNYNAFKGVDLADSRTFIAAFETQVPRVKDSIFWLSYGQFIGIPTAAAYSTMVPYTVLSSPKDSGSVSIMNCHLQFFDIMKFGLDWFGTFGYLTTSPRKEGSVLDLPDAIFGAGNDMEVGIFGDSLHNDVGVNQAGHVIYTGLRYRLPVSCLRHPKIGFEYNHGSKYWMGIMAGGGADLVNKLDVSGDAYELYYIQPLIKNHMFLRLGWVFLDYKYYSTSLFASRAGTESDLKVHNVYLLADIRF